MSPFPQNRDQVGLYELQPGLGPESFLEDLQRLSTVHRDGSDKGPPGPIGRRVQDHRLSPARPSVATVQGRADAALVDEDQLRCIQTWLCLQEAFSGLEDVLTERVR